MIDEPGSGDANCNGVDPPVTPTPDDFGLTPNLGRPDLPEGAVDLVLLITIDALRYEAFRPDITPNLVRLGLSGITFTRLYAAGTSTHTSTGLIQRGDSHGRALASRFAELGIRTGAVLPIRDRVFAGNVEGFADVARPTLEKERWGAREVTDHALLLLPKPGERRYLWVHYFDAHAPYELHEAQAASLGPEVRGSYRSYLSGLRLIDAEVARLIARVSPRAVVLVASDHGEGFGEHGVVYHHVSGYEPIVHVPGILIAPGLGSIRYGELTSHRDIYPTLLGAFGCIALEPGIERFGRSWFRLRDGPKAPLHRFVYVRSGRSVSGQRSLSPMVVLIEGHFKIIESIEDQLAEVFDEDADPNEVDDLASREPKLRLWLHMHAALARDLDQWPQWPQPQFEFSE
jgi:arylsulfatase A-like enzyme